MKEPKSFIYFLDNCDKRTPSKEYFWMIYSILKPVEYSRTVEKVLQMAKKSVDINDSMPMTPEIALIFHSINNTNSLAYHGNFKS